MFIVIQIPVIDGRLWKVGDQSRLRKPQWSGLRDVGRQFMRDMGVILERKGGSLDGWDTEGIYCSAANWLRYPDQVPIKLELANGESALVVPAFRRWMGDNRLVYRLEVGWRIKLSSSTKPAAWVIEEVIAKLFSMDLLLCLAQTERRVKVMDIAEQAFKAFVHASTSQKTVPDLIAKDLLRLGQTLLFLEFRENELAGNIDGRGWREVSLGPDFGPGLTVNTARTMLGRQSVALYCLHRQGIEGDDRKTLRSVRLNILRMHAEIEGLEEFLQWRRSPELSRIVSGAPDLVNVYLEEALKRLRPDRGSRADSVGFRIARRAVETATEGRVAGLVNEVIVRLEDPSQKLLGMIQGLQLGSMHPNLKLEIDMSTNKTENKNVFGPNASGVAISQGGANSTNTATATYTIEKFEQARDEVEKAVNEAVAALTDPEQKSELKMRLKDLKKADQDRPWYSVTAKGLKDAASAIGGAATPIVAATAKLLAILG